jgi:hypothetical protein
MTPARPDLDEATRPKPEISQAVNLPQNLLDPAKRDRCQQPATVGIDERYALISRAGADQHLNGSVRRDETAKSPHLARHANDADNRAAKPQRITRAQ